MDSDYLDTIGEVIFADDLAISKARDLACKIKMEAIPFIKIVECRKTAQEEKVVFDVSVEVPQVCVHPIFPVERIAVTFFASDDRLPIVEAMRKTFPRVPHLNLHIQEFPRNLCLYEEDYEEIKLTWTSERFIRWIREWLALTARGELHQDEQPLEQILIDHVGSLVLPRSVLETEGVACPLFIENIRPVDAEKLFLFASSKNIRDEKKEIIASMHSCSPQMHGVINKRPTTLTELATLVNSAGLNILDELRERLKDWYRNKKITIDPSILLVIRFPKKRDTDSVVEEVETRGFLLSDITKDGKRGAFLNIRDIGIRIGAWDIYEDNVVGILLAPDPKKTGNDICVDVLNISWEITRTMAAMLNGDTSENTIRITAIGAGALGSQVLINLARRGFGNWTIIDNDRLMPHNIVRHGLGGLYQGFKKSEAVAFEANSIISNENPFSAISTDVLSPGGKEVELDRCFKGAEVILDMSTSIAVARKLTFGIESDARRISIFLTPSGNDLVLLVEDKRRNIPLYSLEMQYYRAIANNGALVDHFHIPGEKKRYGQSCRDITSTIPQHFVALHAAIGANAIKNTIENSDAIVSVWRTDEQGNVKRVDVKLESVIRHKIHGWTVMSDWGLIKKLDVLRESKLPNETGGVLLGSYDLSRKIIYIVDALPSPRDSTEWPALYIRGRKGLRNKVEEVEAKTHGMLGYIGEWHSHPKGARIAASSDDIKVFAWLTEIMMADGLPPTMMIAGDDGRVSFYVEEISEKENLLI